MKRFYFVLLLVALSAVSLAASHGCAHQKMSQEVFQEKKKAFLIENAGLTSEEADAFFPVYFELQQKKKEINDDMRKLVKSVRKTELTEEGYEEVMMRIYDTRIESDKLDKEYYEEFRKILSSGKIFKIYQAELKFNRTLVRSMCGSNDSKSDK